MVDFLIAGHVCNGLIYHATRHRKMYSERGRYVIGRAKRAPHWGVQSRFRVIDVIGERSEPLSDKLGGEICVATCALVCYGLTTA